ncbi:MAG: 3-phosphoglycerate dehydrogenase, partial [Proteobacteria bacterium]|nr:3-phosphoglycerate dehydrogenase [Pseudomonadota bacterium]
MARILMEPFSRALVIESPHPSLDEHLVSVGIAVRREPKVPDTDFLIEKLREVRAQVLFKRSRVPVTREVVASCPDLHLVQLCSIGDDSVDKVACADHGVLVCNDPVSNGRSVVELVVAHLIALSRRLYETDVATHANRWEKSAAGRFEVLGKCLGIVGLGNIGRQVARVAEALGMEVLFYDNRFVAQEVGGEMGWEGCRTLAELFQQSDMVTVHLSASDVWGNSNDGILDAHLGELGAERDKSSPRIFLNLARGNLFSTDELLKAVAEGAIRRAAVDVYPLEPAPGVDGWLNPYADEPRISCTPHIGAATQEAQPRIAKRVSDTVGALSLRGALRDCVFAPRAKLAFSGDLLGRAILAVAHSVARGTKKAIDDAIFEAEVDNLGSMHRDFDVGVAYDLSLLDRPLNETELNRLVQRAGELV